MNYIPNVGSSEDSNESYFESKVSNAEIVVQFPISNSFLDSLWLASSLVSLHVPMSARPRAGNLAALAYGMDGKCTVATATRALEKTFMDGSE